MVTCVCIAILEMKQSTRTLMMHYRASEDQCVEYDVIGDDGGVNINTQ